MPAAIVPMKATLVDRPPRGRRLALRGQVGRRARHLLHRRRGAAHASRNGHRCERQYPELAVIPHYIAAQQAILDGEIAVLDEKGVIALRS